MTAPYVDPAEFYTRQAQRSLDRQIPARFAAASCDHPQVAAWAERFLVDPASVDTLILTGITGTGKTRQCWGLIRRVVAGYATRSRRLGWRYRSHPQFNDQMRPKPDGSHTVALGPYLGAELLILEDLGAGVQSDWTGDSLHRLVDHRWSHRLPTVYTSNFNLSQMAGIFGDRIVSRLADSTRVVLKGTDRRWGNAA